MTDVVTARIALLTTQQRRVLEQVADGKSNKEICRSVRLGMSTVKTHVHHSMRTLRARNRTHAAVMFLRWQFNHAGERG